MNGLAMRLRGMNYRKADDNRKCKTCANSIVFQYSKTYTKCTILGVTHGSKTDIKRNNTCDLWKERKDDERQDKVYAG